MKALLEKIKVIAAACTDIGETCELRVNVKDDFDSYFKTFHLTEMEMIRIAKKDIDLYQAELEGVAELEKKTKEKTRIAIALNKLTKVVDSLNISIFQSAARKVKFSKEFADNITDLVVEYPHSTKLYVFLINYMLSDCIKTDLCSYILNQVSRAKTSIFVDDMKLNSAKLAKSNTPMTTFGLKPVTKVDSLPNLTKLLFGRAASFEQLAKDYYVIVMNKFIKNPLVFDSNNLHNPLYMNDYKQPDEHGLSQKLIEKYETLAFLKTKSKWDFSIKTYGTRKKYSVVFEAIAPKQYRVVDKFVYNYAVLGGGRYKPIKTDELYTLINYIDNKCRAPVHTVASQYHKLQTKTILENMFLPIKFSTSEISLASKIVQSEFLRNEVLIKMKKRILTEFNKLNDKNKIKSNKDIGTIIHDDELSNILGSVLVEQYDLYTFKNKKNSTDFPFSETLKSFLSELDYINSDFVRKLHDEYVAKKIDQKIFEDSASAKKTYFSRFLFNLLETVLKKVITNNRNIYQRLLYKNKLLKLSII